MQRENASIKGGDIWTSLQSQDFLENFNKNSRKGKSVCKNIYSTHVFTALCGYCYLNNGDLLQNGVYILDIFEVLYIQDSSPLNFLAKLGTILLTVKRVMALSLNTRGVDDFAQHTNNGSK